MSLRRILVTGSGGFVGGHLLPVLRQMFRDAEVSGTTSDVTDAGAVESEVATVRPDALVHLAAIAAIPAARQDPGQAWRVNLHGTLNVARAVQTAAPGCVLLFASTSDLYGSSFQAGVPVAEDAVLAPLNTYGATKAAADLALGAMAAEGLRVIRVRPFNHTGPGQSASFVVAAFARQVARVAAGLQPPVLDVGALEPVRDMLDVRDVCAAYALCLRHADVLAPGTVLNVASGEPRRVGDVLADLMAVGGIEAEVRTDAGKLRPTDIARAVGDARLARRVLGWSPSVPWATTLQDVLADWHERVLTEPEGVAG